METAMDFLFKFYFRMPIVRQWLIDNNDSWEFIMNWCEKNKDPPMLENNKQNRQYLVLSKENISKIRENEIRFNSTKNKVLYYYRHSQFELMKKGSMIDLS